MMNDEESDKFLNDQTKMLSEEQPDGTIRKPQDSKLETRSEDETTHSDFVSGFVTFTFIYNLLAIKK